MSTTNTTLRAVFLTLFLDLIGFSMIFPLFPAMLDWYTQHDSDSATLRFFLDLIHDTGWLGAGVGEAVPIVLFGGLLPGFEVSGRMVKHNEVRAVVRRRRDAQQLPEPLGRPTRRRVRSHGPAEGDLRVVPRRHPPSGPLYTSDTA